MGLIVTIAAGSWRPRRRRENTQPQLRRAGERLPTQASMGELVTKAENFKKSLENGDWFKRAAMLMLTIRTGLNH